jgi:hypothetical protein
VFKWLAGILAGLFGVKYIILNSVVNDDGLVVSKGATARFDDDAEFNAFDVGLVTVLQSSRVEGGGNG